MPVSKAQIRAQTKWIKKTYDRIELLAKKEEGAKIRAAAEAAGQSASAYCLAAVRERMEREQQGGKSMSNLDSSIRKAMKFYGPALRAGHYWPSGMTGVTPEHFKGFLKAAYCDYEDGTVTDIRLYTVGDAMEARDYHGETVDITDAIDEWLRGRDHITWDGLIDNIAAVVKEGR